jgi:iron complex outermembrane receptor protein
MSEIARSWSRIALLASGGLLTIMAATSSPALAQSTADAAAPAGGGELEEIVVTANRRDADIQKTALAITAVSADTLVKNNVTQLADINGTVPGLEITKASGYETDVSIRGVGLGTPENELTTSPGIATFIDGVYIANSISLDETLFDLDHVEVLRGPQGALYGQSSTGGALLLVSKQPVLDQFSGSGAVTVGDYSLHREQGEVNIPISDQFAIRVSAQNYGHDGFTRNNYFPKLYLDDANDVDGKIAALYQPSDDFKATVTTDFYSSDTNGSAQKNINDPNPSPYVITQDYPGRFALNTNLSHLNLEWDLPWFTLKSVTGYQYLDHHQQEDSSRSAVELIGQYDDVAAWTTHLQNFNEEFDILSNPGDKLDWITGVFASSQKTRQFVAEFGGDGQPGNLTVPPDIDEHSAPHITFGQDLRVSRQAYAWFAQGTYHILDDLRLTGGIRLNYDGYATNTITFGNPKPGLL